MTPRTKKFGAKKAVYQKKKKKKIQLGFSSKDEMPSLVRLGSEILALESGAKLMNSLWIPVVSILPILGRQRTAHGTDRETI